MKKFVGACVAIGISWAAQNSAIVPYGAYINYTGSTNRDDAFIAGAYYSSYHAPYKIEATLEHLQIAYKNTTPKYKQNSIALKGHYYKGYNWDFSAGLNVLFTKQGSVDETQKVFMGGVTYYKAYDYNFGMNLFYSDYKGFHVWQISPKVGKYLGDYQSDLGSFYLEGGIDYIAISDNAAQEDSYVTFNAKIQNFHGPWTTTLEGSIGKNSYRVANDGFVVFNLGEEYKYSYGLNIARALGSQSSLKFGFTRAKFEESGNDAYSNIFLLTYALGF